MKGPQGSLCLGPPESLERLLRTRDPGQMWRWPQLSWAYIEEHLQCLGKIIIIMSKLSVSVWNYDTSFSSNPMPVSILCPFKVVVYKQLFWIISQLKSLYWGCPSDNVFTLEAAEGGLHHRVITRLDAILNSNRQTWLHMCSHTNAPFATLYVII